MEKNYNLIGKDQFGKIYKVALKKTNKENSTEQEFKNEINTSKKVE